MAGPFSERTPGYRARPAAARQPASVALGTFLRGIGRVEVLAKYGPIAARILISQIFLISGVMKIMNPAGAEKEMMEKGMFWIPFFLVAATIVEIVGGLSLLLGYFARVGALLLFLYLIPVTLTFHHFWTYTGEQQRINTILFQHNLALMGGLLLVMTLGSGPLSLDIRRERRPERGLRS